MALSVHNVDVRARRSFSRNGRCACKAAGFDLDEVHRLLTDASPDRPASRALAAEKLTQLDRQMAVLAQARAIIELGMTCACPSIDSCTCEVHGLLGQ
ncbi:hypothetical protein BH09ACT8_BH09ACT8_63420 [soil metagenome]